MTDGLNIGPAKKKPGPPKGTRPSGRQKGTPNKATASIRDIARQYTDKAIKALVDVLGDKSEPASARVGAANALLERAAHVARSQGDLPPHTCAILGMLGLTIIEMIQRSPDDLAEQLGQIAQAARRT